ncbi:unnamed protein product [Aphanomyces euteiches]|uniref:Enoyl reductase (ER) domain-containing protein n=1 Tax=Aphanomyces euteiches TaxID=100861 RepID=A0A6G0XKY1_9STRA|nr:hypothetical protein Ae201684_003585 [Aphanomyces euteiches]KAH9084913.1 hypothetical protein Ae201684P_002145 [Aphanomyces euteiches]KAH9155161.1 hypothetical protein AeRB84_002839 [Aphanomyces euteiches]
MSSSVPAKMRALVQVKKVSSFKQEDTNACFEVREVDVPELKDGEALVKIECSPINPSNLSIITGSYNSAAQSPLPSLLGTEGSGVVVATKSDAVKIGQRVAILKDQGIWAEYAALPGISCVGLPDDVTFEGGCSLFVNPLTAVAFVHIALARGAKTIVHTAGASALGKMLVQHAKERGVNVLAVVRRPEQVQALQALGAEYVVDTSEADWKVKFKELATTLEATLGFDAVSGGLTGDILSNMPNGSEVQVYGGLSGHPVSGVNTLGLIFEGKKVSGFWLVKYLGGLEIPAKIGMIRQVTAGLNKAFKTVVNKSYSLEEAVSAFHDYTGNMSDNKIAFKPSQRA